MEHGDPSSGTAVQVPLAGHAPAASPVHNVAEGRSALALTIIAGACGLGLLADGLLRVRWGLNLALWVGALVGVILWIANSRGRLAGNTAVVLGMVAIFFASGLAIRDAEALAVFNVGATLSALLLLGMAILGGPAPAVTVARLRDFVHGTVLLGWRTAIGVFPLVLRDARVKALGASPRARLALAVLRGVLLATPLLIIFGSLFMAADAAFNDLVVRLIRLDFERVGSHLAIILFFSWISAGFLHGALIERAPAPIADLDELSIGPVEAGAVLVLLDLLFALFIGVQARYLFGGASVVEQTAGLTYAEYARRGFFELAFAAALVVPVLLAINLLMRRERPRHERMFRWLAGALAVLVGLVMLSAAHRMRLYQHAYGMTESRLYASAFMIWIALVLAWFGRTVLRGAGRRFAFGAVVAGWLVLAGLNIANPDRLVARYNLERAVAGQSFDAVYAGQLGGDAVPVVLLALRTLPGAAVAWGGPDAEDRIHDNANRCRLRDKLRIWAAEQDADWRSWNLGRSRARHEAAANRALIEDIDCVMPVVQRQPPAMRSP